MDSDGYENETRRLAQLLFYFGVTVTLSIMLTLQMETAGVESIEWWDESWVHMGALAVLGMITGTIMIAAEPFVDWFYEKVWPRGGADV